MRSCRARWTRGSNAPSRCSACAGPARSPSRLLSPTTSLLAAYMAYIKLEEVPFQGFVLLTHCCATCVYLPA